MSAGDFDKAVAYVRSIPKGQSTLSQAQQLSFYANFKQATVGTCKQHGGSQPWAVQLEARAKWDAWNALDDKDADTAKSDYVKMLDECVPSWRN
jgi:diazepam-binding inhibitor (GABA receptor modulating acyl-CoA-binding protein)